MKKKSFNEATLSDIQLVGILKESLKSLPVTRTQAALGEGDAFIASQNTPRIEGDTTLCACMNRRISEGQQNSVQCDFSLIYLPA